MIAEGLDTGGDILVSEFVAVLWRARVIIVIGGLVAGAAAFAATPTPTKTFRGRTLLSPVLGPPSDIVGMFDFRPSDRDGELKLEVPVRQMTEPYSPLDPVTLQALVQADASAERASSAQGIDLRNSITVSDVPRTRMIAVDAESPSADRARDASHAVANAVVDIDRKTMDATFDAAIQRVEVQIHALQSPDAADLPEVLRGADAQIASQYFSLLRVNLAAWLARLKADRAAGAPRLAIAAAEVTEDTPVSQKLRNTVAGFVVGVLLIAVGAVGVRIWRRGIPA